MWGALQADEADDGPGIGTTENPYMPMEVLGDINEDGLGLTSWWGAQEEEGEHPADDAAMDNADADE